MLKTGLIGITAFCILLFSFIFDISAGRALYDYDSNKLQVGKIGVDPYVTIGVHRVGKLGLTIFNRGQLGLAGGNFVDPRDPSIMAPSGIYPYPGNNSYLYRGAFWIGAIVGRDTLVSVGADGWIGTQEMWPDPYPRGDVVFKSLSNASDIDAISEEDFSTMFTDTVTNPAFVGADPFDGRPHVPLNIEVNQRSYAWSYSYAEDFVLFDLSIKNIGNRVLNKVYMGLYIDGDVGGVGGGIAEAVDDICGFKRAIDSPFGCGWIDTINIAWISDNNGLDDSNTEDECPFSGGSYNDISGMRVVRTPSDSLKYSFNWWISNGAAPLDFGPRRVGTELSPFRDFGGFLGTPMGDRNKYYIMSTEEFDYDQLFCAKDNTIDGWLERGPDADDFADGYDTRYLLSFGPFDISPGEVLPLTFAYVSGEEFLSDCDAYINSFNRYAPEEYYNTFDFDGVGLNSIWATMIYDNPGVDTDGDGYRGKYRICIDSVPDGSGWVYDEDTVYYQGDNVPDFKGASPPPAPELWVINPYPLGDTIRSLVTPHITKSNSGEVTIQWYGYRSETTQDPFSGEIDFEGYRIYTSLTEEIDGFVQLSSFDKENYNRYEYNRFAPIGAEPWELNDLPFSLSELKGLYGNDFNPNNWTIDHPFPAGGTSYYFAAQDWNRSELTDTTLIHKIYPDQPPPTTLDHDSARVYYRDEMTDEGYFKYYMYEYVVRNLLPSQLYYFSATAFDFGSPSSGLASLETRANKNYVAEYPQNQNKLVKSGGLDVIVYPNPYRGDGNYKEIGFEGRGIGIDADERIRRIHFTNLPHKCTIRIFSIDGDLVRQIEHDKREGHPRSMHEEWDLITRNTQMVVSGIYYFSVESELGSQVGKIVIIL